MATKCDAAGIRTYCKSFKADSGHKMRECRKTCPCVNECNIIIDRNSLTVEQSDGVTAQWIALVTADDTISSEPFPRHC